VVKTAALNRSANPPLSLLAMLGAQLTVHADPVRIAADNSIHYQRLAPATATRLLHVCD
jgi:hypothetical protein